MRFMALSLPAKTGWRARASTRSMTVDSGSMKIPLIITTVDESPDVLSNPFASRIPKSRFDRRQHAPGRPALGDHAENEPAEAPRTGPVRSLVSRGGRG